MDMQDATVAVWDMTSPTQITVSKRLMGHSRNVVTVDLDEKYIVSGSLDGTIKVHGVVEERENDNMEEVRRGWRGLLSS